MKGARTCYDEYIINGNYGFDRGSKKLMYGKAKILTPGLGYKKVKHGGNELSTKMMKEMDVAYWYGALDSPGDTQTSEIITRLFTILYHAGVMYYGKDNQWHDWYDSDYPIASVVSHGGRVLIQLPRASQTVAYSRVMTPSKFSIKKVRTSANEDADHSFWNWFTNPKVKARNAGSHSLKALHPPVATISGHQKCLQEGGLSLGTLAKGRHYGVNVWAGGFGNVNPISGNTINQEGCHGHLYIFYRPPRPAKYGGILIGCEGCEDGKTDDMSGITHNFRAISSEMGVTGGKKWKKMQGGPKGGSEEDVNSIFVDLSGGWEYLRDRTFSKDKLNAPPTPVAPANQFGLISKWPSYNEFKTRVNNDQSCEEILYFLRTFINGANNLSTLRDIEQATYFWLQSNNTANMDKRKAVQQLYDLAQYEMDVMQELL